jgi:hypothetical protein
MADLLSRDNEARTGSRAPPKVRGEPEVVIGAALFEAHRLSVARSRGKLRIMPIQPGPE